MKNTSKKSLKTVLAERKKRKQVPLMGEDQAEDFDFSTPQQDTPAVVGKTVLSTTLQAPEASKASDKDPGTLQKGFAKVLEWTTALKMERPPKDQRFGALMTDQERAKYQAESFHLSYLLETPDENYLIHPRDAYRNRDITLLCYLPLLFWIPLVSRPRSRFARFHANQGLIMNIVIFSWWIIEAILTSFFNDQLLYFLSIILASFNIFVLILIGFGILSVTNEQARELPIIGRFRIITTIRGQRKSDDDDD